MRLVTRFRPLVALATALSLLAPFAMSPLPVRAASIACGTPGADGSPATITGIVNTYYPGTAATQAAGSTSLSLGTANAGGAQTPIAIGDLLLVIQMQGATINATDTNAYGANNASGAGSLSATAGQYEYVTAVTAGTSGSTITIRGTGAGNGLLHTYTRAAASATQGQQTYQIVRVPQYGTTTLTSGVTAAAWGYPAGGSVLDSTGGVLAIESTGALNLGGATISLDGKGFRGGGRYVANGTQTGTNPTEKDDYVTLSTLPYDATKGEGIAGSPIFMFDGTTQYNTGVEGYPNGAMARGAPGNAGGGGTDPNIYANDQNTGGGGGGNAGAGGLGGNSWKTNIADGGKGGAAFTPSVTAIVMGGGGGGGTNNNGTGAPNGSSGAPGGGIALIRAASLAGTGTITANGTTPPAPANDGGGGGGAGGSIVVLTTNASAAGLTAVANGGAGSNTNQGTMDPHGPGGGGGGGLIVTSGAATSTTANGGANGTTPNTTNGAQEAYGALPGSTGSVRTAAITASPGSPADNICSIALVPNKSVNATNVVRNGTLSYTIVAANNGPGVGDGTVFADTLPAGLTILAATCGSPTRNATTGKTAACNTAAPTIAGQTVTSAITTLPPGTSVTFTITATAATGVSYANDATMTPPAYYGIAASTSQTVTTLVDPKVAITKTASASPVLQGAVLTYTIVATNVGVTGGAVPANGTVLSDTVPANFTNVSVACTAVTGGAVCPTGTIAVTANAFTTNVPTFPSGATATFTVTATASTIGATTNTATLAAATGAALDPSSTTSASANVQINPSEQMVKTVRNVTQNGAAVTANQAKPGDTLEYVLTFTNNTGTTLSNFAFNDTVPAHTNFLNASCVQPATCTITAPAVGSTGTPITWAIAGSLAPSAVYSVKFQVQVQ